MLRLQWLNEAGTVAAESEVPDCSSEPFIKLWREFELNELRKQAAEGGFPGPDTFEHPEGHEGPCHCHECLIEMCT